MDMTREITKKIGEFFVQKKTDLINHQSKNEINLLQILCFQESLSFEKDSSNGEGLFGWSNLKSDYRPQKESDTIIEVKYIRTTISDGNKKNHNECEIKNSLSQIIEQAICKNAKEAILVIIDSGRAAERDWNSREQQFLSMFKNNSAGINLSIVRIKVDLANNDVTYQVY
jgi:hypothetical protein